MFDKCKMVASIMAALSLKWLFQLRYNAERGCFRFYGPVDSMDSVKLPSDN